MTEPTNPYTRQRDLDIHERVRLLAEILEITVDEAAQYMTEHYGHDLEAGIAYMDEQGIPKSREYVNSSHPEHQYLSALERIYRSGTDLPNERTGISCRTVINVDLQYDATTSIAPILTTRKVNPKLAIAELIGYIRGYTNAEDFANLGTRSWFANANETQAWLDNPNRKGENDVGHIYGAVARNWPLVNPDHNRVGQINLFQKVYDNLKAGKDDRGEIVTFWNPGMFHLGALRPCMYEHQFSLLDDDLYLNSTQRSSDWPLGTTANMIQVWLLLRLMAQITGKNPKMAYHRNVNSHIYGNQLDLVKEQLSRSPIFLDDTDSIDLPRIEINPDIKTLEDLETWVTLKDFEIYYPRHHEPIKYPFAT